MTMEAVFKNGVFTPVEPVDLPENTRVAFQARVLETRATEANEIERQAESTKRLMAILLQSSPSGETDSAERHNEHQS
jgi:predicted DNA-binding antitoxin AbrB/MazE fold protein